MIKRFLLSAVLFVLPLWAHADWAADRDASAGYVTVTTLATAVDEAVPFAVVYLSDLPADFHTAMTTASDTDGKTLRVSTSDGVTKLACVPIGVNTSTDAGCLIFLGTGMSASVDVDYRIYVGNAALSMPAASAGEQLVFAAYVAVYFPGVDVRDFTAGGRTLTAVNSPGTAASGYEGITAATYNGTSSYHKYEGTPGISNWPATIELLARSEDSTVEDIPFSLANSTDNDPLFLLRTIGNVAGDYVGMYARGDTGSLSNPTTSSGFTASTEHYFVAKRDANTGTSTVIIDANDGTKGTSATTITAPTFDRMAIGALYRSTASSQFNGRVAVALLSSSVRSADYVSTNKRNWDGALYTAGAWTPNDSDVIAGSTGWVLFQTAGQPSTANMDWIDTTNALLDDATYTYCTVSDAPTTTEYLNLTNPPYGTIPTGAPSYTVEFRVKGYRGNSSGGDRLYDETIQFIDDTGTRVGTNLAKTSEDWTTSATTRDYVLSGYSPDGTEFTSASGLAIRVTGADAVGTLDPRVVTAWIRVSWTGSDPLYNTRGFFALTE